MSAELRLYKAVRKHGNLTWQEIVDAGQHGADTGWGGFTYTTDCCKFYQENKRDIWELLAEDAENFGQSVPEMISHFGRVNMANDVDTFENLLAWYALERVGQWIDNTRENAA